MLPLQSLVSQGCIWIKSGSYEICGSEKLKRNGKCKYHDKLNKDWIIEAYRIKNKDDFTELHETIL